MSVEGLVSSTIDFVQCCMKEYMGEGIDEGNECKRRAE
jgi:hypothetical protein